MKNLRKFLIVFVVVALLVCGAVITGVSASTEYVGDLATANQLLDEVYNQSALEDKVIAMTSVAEYVNDAPIDPSADGYAAFTARYDAAILDIMTGLLDQVDAAPDKADKANKLEALYRHAEVVRVYDPSLKDSAQAPTVYAQLLTRTYDTVCAVATEMCSSISGTTSSLKERGDAFMEHPFDIAAQEFIAEYEPFATNMSKLQSLVETCVVDTALMTNPDAYRALTASIDSLELAELEALTVVYYTVEYTTSTLPLVYTNRAADRVNAYKRTHQIASSTSGYNSVMSKVNAVNADLAARTAAQKDAIEKDAPVSEYDYKGLLSHDMEDKRFPYQFHHSNSTSQGAGNLTFMEIVDDDPYLSNYLLLEMGLAKGEDGNQAQSGADAAYFEFYNVMPDAKNGLVFEFDLMSHGDFKSLTIQCVENSTLDNSRCFGQFLIIKDNWVLTGQGQERLAENVFTPGEWTHFTLIWAPDGGNGTPAVTVYIDYEWVGKWWSAPALSGGVKKPYMLTCMRLNPGSTHTTVGFDNFEIYPGTSYRVRDRLTNMTTAEKFAFYVDTFTDSERSIDNRSYALTQAEKLYDSVKNDASVASYVEIYNNFDKEVEIIIPARDITYAELKTMVDALIYDAKDPTKRDPVTTENLAKKSEDLKTIETFMSEKAAFILPSEARIVALRSEIDATKLNIERLTDVKELIYALQRFDRAATLSAMKNHKELVEIWYETCAFVEEANYLLAKTDPIVETFEGKVGMTVPEYYASMQNRLDTREKLENSKRVVECMGYVTGMEGYEDTEEFWTTNYEYINTYVLIVRDVVHSGIYDASYEGFAEARAQLDVLDAYFYVLLLREQAAHMQAQLDKYPQTDSYIERLGICTYVRNYIINNNIDKTHEIIKPVEQLLVVYENEVKSQEGPYTETVAQNTQYFISIINKMGAKLEYKDLKPLYEEALGYFYSMNIDSAEAQAAIAKFYAYQADIKSAEENSALFIAYTKQLKKATKARDIYPILVSCSAYLEGIEEDIEGVSAALTLYNEKLAAYNESISGVNGDIDEAASVVCSVRSITVHEAVLAVLKSIFAN